MEAVELPVISETLSLLYIKLHETFRVLHSSVNTFYFIVTKINKKFKMFPTHVQITLLFLEKSVLFLVSACLFR